MHKPTDHIRVRAKHGILRDAPQGGSGIVPEPALEANTLISGAKRQGLNFPELPCERRTDPAEPLSANPLR
jgi:hypothetical protein